MDFLRFPRSIVAFVPGDSAGVSNGRELTIRVKPDRTGTDADLGASGDAALVTGLDAAFAQLGAKKDDQSGL